MRITAKEWGEGYAPPFHVFFAPFFVQCISDIAVYGF